MQSDPIFNSKHQIVHRRSSPILVILYIFVFGENIHQRNKRPKTSSTEYPFSMFSTIYEVLYKMYG